MVLNTLHLHKMQNFKQSDGSSVYVLVMMDKWCYKVTKPAETIIWRRQLRILPLQPINTKFIHSLLSTLCYSHTAKHGPCLSYHEQNISQSIKVAHERYITEAGRIMLYR